VVVVWLGRVTVGIKAGVVAGVVYGVIGAVANYFKLLWLRELILPLIVAAIPAGYEIGVEEAFALVLISGSFFVFLVGVAMGLIVGGIYGWGYERIPGGTSLFKGLVFGVVIWIVLDVVLGFANLSYGFVFYVVSLVVGLVSSLIFGVLISIFYNKYMPKQLPSDQMSIS